MRESPNSYPVIGTIQAYYKYDTVKEVSREWSTEQSIGGFVSEWVSEKVSGWVCLSYVGSTCVGELDEWVGGWVYEWVGLWVYEWVSG